MYPNREVFKNSPLALVAAEILFTDSPRLRQASTLDQIAIALEDLLPVSDPIEAGAVDIIIGPGGVQTPNTQTIRGRQLRTYDSTLSLSIFPNRVSVETTAYATFEHFSDGMQAAVTALNEARVRPAVQRIGMRYINEVRPPGAPVTTPAEWSKWVDARLVDQLTLGPAGANALQSDGSIVFDLGRGSALTFRYGVLPNGAVVGGNLVRASFDHTKPFIVLDLDTSQQFDGPESVVLDPEVVLQTLGSVHRSSGETFQRVITDMARAHFRQEAGQ